jgi:hypothetical protein
MDATPFHDAYYSDLQSLYGLWVIPLAFLVWRFTSPPEVGRALVPEATRFVSGLTIFFAVATMLDPFSTGPLIRSDALADTKATSLIPFFFVLLGDLRVLLLAIGVARPERGLRQNLGWAAGTMLIVPVATAAVEISLGLFFDELHGQIRWMVYEAGFLVLCVALSRRWVPRSLGGDPLYTPKATYLRGLFAYSAAYYALWLAADVLIVAGLDVGWAIRMVPNQLYYGFWVVFAYARFFSATSDEGGKTAR